MEAEQTEDSEGRDLARALTTQEPSTKTHIKNRNSSTSARYTMLKSYENTMCARYERIEYSSSSYLMSLFFMSFILSTKKTGVTAAIHATLIKSVDPRLPRIRPLERFTTCVSGRTALAKSSTGAGRAESGKNVPLSRNIGVMKRKPG